MHVWNLLIQFIQNTLSSKMQSYFKIEIQVFKNGKIRDFSTFEVNYLKSYVWLRKSDIVFEFSIQKRTQINWKFIYGIKKLKNADQCNLSLRIVFYTSNSTDSYSNKYIPSNTDSSASCAKQKQWIMFWDPATKLWGRILTTTYLKNWIWVKYLRTWIHH